MDNLCWYGADRRARHAPAEGQAVEIKIGVQHTPREIVLESGQSAEEVEKAVADALSGSSQLLRARQWHRKTNHHGAASEDRPFRHDSGSPV
jgi:hypothetical protein